MDEAFAYDPDFLMSEALLGLECESFWASQAGRYVKGRAEGEVSELITKLVMAAPEDEKSQRDIRADISVRQRLLQYLDDAIINGENAKFQLDANNY